MKRTILALLSSLLLNNISAQEIYGLSSPESVVMESADYDIVQLNYPTIRYASHSTSYFLSYNRLSGSFSPDWADKVCQNIGYTGVINFPDAMAIETLGGRRSEGWG